MIRPVGRHIPRFENVRFATYSGTDVAAASMLIELGFVVVVPERTLFLYHLSALWGPLSIVPVTPIC
jgi:hypothetical protein